MKCPFDTIPEYVKLVSDYDTWAHKMTDSDAFKLGIDSYKMMYSMMFGSD